MKKIIACLFAVSVLSTAAFSKNFFSQRFVELKVGSKVDFSNVFIGSCTNGRIEDLREVARCIDEIEKYVGKQIKISEKIKSAIIVPGSNIVKFQAEREGLADIFKRAGFEWRNPGCSMCLGMNEDKLNPYDRCASTSNRNFEGRQGYLSRTHLCSPRIATIIAIFGKINLDFIDSCK